MHNVHVRPIRDAEGNAAPVPDPTTGAFLKAAGEWKAATSYWLRCLSRGDVVECEPPAAGEAAAASHETQGSGFDSGAAGHELQGRASAPASAAAAIEPAAPAAAPAASAEAPAAMSPLAADIRAGEALVDALEHATTAV